MLPFKLCGHGIARQFQQSRGVEPSDPAQRRVLRIDEQPPWSAVMNHLGLEQADDRFRQRTVARVSTPTDRALDGGSRYLTCYSTRRRHSSITLRTPAE